MGYIIKLLGTILLLLTFMSTEVNAQSPTITMDLQECIDYAHRNNISLKKSLVQMNVNEVDVKTAKAAFLPSLSSSVSQNYNSRPLGSDFGTETNSYSGNYGINSSLTLYNGGQNRTNLKLSELNVEMSALDVAITESSIEMTIAQFYIQILYATDALEVNQYMLDVSRKNKERGEVLYSVGDINSADLAQLETQEANDKYEVVVAESELRNLILQLKQLLEIDHDTDIAIEIPEINNDQVNITIPTIDNIYSIALNIRPEIKMNELDIESSNLNLTQSRAGYLPTVNLFANINLNHNTTSNLNFSNQLKNNWSNVVGVNVSIPIFNNRKTKSSVEKSTFAITYSKLNLKDSKNQLYRTIESLHNSATNAQMKFAAAQQKLSSVNKSLDLVTQQFELGMKNTIELLTEQSNYISTQQELLEAKYIALLNIILLNHYKGDEIKI